MHKLKNDCQIKKTYKSQKDFPTIIFWIILLVVIYSKRAIWTSNDYLIILLATIVISYITYYFVWTFFGSLTVNIEDQKLVIRKKILAGSIKRAYDLTKITDVKIKEGEESNHFWGFQGVRVYSKNKELLTFRYENKEIVLGKGIKDFEPAEILINLKNAYA